MTVFNSLEKTRPLLVKLDQKWKVDTLLSHRSRVGKGIFIEPDLPPDARNVCSYLLKEQQNLISSGILHNTIQIRRNKPFVDKEEYGHAVLFVLRIVVTFIRA